mmetsp:Transcript_45703/g.74553  ORF Transcript_45703/g.74553 Transcript_45703/m.74553 type:complete len:97 (+) Transcript_45703:126-416(+)
MMEPMHMENSKTVTSRADTYERKFIHEKVCTSKTRKQDQQNGSRRRRSSRKNERRQLDPRVEKKAFPEQTAEAPEQNAEASEQGEQCKEVPKNNFA